MLSGKSATNKFTTTTTNLVYLAVVVVVVETRKKTITETKVRRTFDRTQLPCRLWPTTISFVLIVI